jgi:hypothetical protein
MLPRSVLSLSARAMRLCDPAPLQPARSTRHRHTRLARSGRSTCYRFSVRTARPAISCPNVSSQVYRHTSVLDLPGVVIARQALSADTPRLFESPWPGSVLVDACDSSQSVVVPSITACDILSPDLSLQHWLPPPTCQGSSSGTASGRPVPSDVPTPACSGRCVRPPVPVLRVSQHCSRYPLTRRQRWCMIRVLGHATTQVRATTERLDNQTSQVVICTCAGRHHDITGLRFTPRLRLPVTRHDTGGEKSDIPWLIGPRPIGPYPSPPLDGVSPCLSG